jgi:TetR/AcrR family transcriptional repressor of mexJK operon
MKSDDEKQSARKHRVIALAATTVFIERGYEGASMDEVAARAGVSKQTIYKHFADKERLFAEIILATTDQVDQVIALVSDALAETRDLQGDLRQLGRRFLATLMDPQLLQLRRLVIANADRMPTLGRSWYEQGFERVLATLAACFERLARQNLLLVDDPRVAANHFVGMLLWIPINEAMFTGDDRPHGEAALNRFADAAVRAFLRAYGLAPSATPEPPR